MNSRLQFYCLDVPRILIGEQIVHKEISKKARALLFYLATTARPQARDSLTMLLWPEMSDSRARRNLRTTLSDLRKLLVSALEITNETVTLSPKGYWSDLNVLQDALAREASPAQKLLTLQQALNLYQGDFLQGFHVRNAEPFEEWMIGERERYRLLLIDGLSELITYAIALQDYITGITTARRLVTLEPWLESGHAQLIRLLGKNGQRAEALAQYETCRQIMQAEFGVEPGAEVTAAYAELQATTEPPQSPIQLQTPPEARIQPAQHNLPVESTSFVGRTDELDRVVTLLADPACRLLTILGPGGIGKSRLALAVAHQLVVSCADGITYIPFASLNLAEFPGTVNPLLTALADALTISLSTQTAPLQQLATYLATDQKLLLFDNMEHLVAHADVLGALLAQAPEIKILVTSRERLQLQEEWLFPLKGLAYPSHNEMIAWEQHQQGWLLNHYSAVALFEQRARQVQPEFDVHDSLPAVTEICRLVEGMPLAVELAVAWVRQMSCQAIAEEVRGGIDLLQSNLRNLPARHRSMRVVFEQTWQRLPAVEQQLLAKLAIFRGGFDRDAAAASADASLWSLTELVDKSLLGIDQNGRYTIHELLRQFALEQLHTVPGAYPAVRKRHCQYYLGIPAVLYPQWSTGQTDVLSRQVLADIENIRIAWYWAVDHDLHDVLLPAIVTLWWVYESKGWVLESHDLFQHAVAHLVDDRPTVESMKRKGASTSVLQGTSNPPTHNLPQMTLVGLLKSALGLSQQRLGKVAQAEQSLAAGVGLLRQAGPAAAKELIFGLWFYGVVLQMRGAYTDALQTLQEALQRCRQQELPFVHAYILTVYTQTSILVGRYADAEMHLIACEELVEGFVDQHCTGYNLTNRGRLEQMRGNYAKAKASYQAAFTWRRERADQMGIAQSLNDLGTIQRLLQGYRQAVHYHEQALQTANKAQLKSESAKALWGLGCVAEKTGNYHEAQEWFNRSQTTFSAQSVLGFSLPTLGWAELALERWDVAAVYFHDVLIKAMEREQLPVVLDAIAGLAALDANGGKEELAAAWWAFVINHAATTAETRQRVAVLQETTLAQMAATTRKRAIAHSQTLQINDLAALRRT